MSHPFHLRVFLDLNRIIKLRQLHSYGWGSKSRIQGWQSTWSCVCVRDRERSGEMEMGDATSNFEDAWHFFNIVSNPNITVSNRKRYLDSHLTSRSICIFLPRLVYIAELSLIPRHPFLLPLGWPKSSFQFLRKILWENLNKLSGRPKKSLCSPVGAGWPFQPRTKGNTVPSSCFCICTRHLKEHPPKKGGIVVTEVLSVPGTWYVFILLTILWGRC